jgi:large repetitive protein
MSGRPGAGVALIASVSLVLSLLAGAAGAASENRYLATIMPDAVAPSSGGTYTISLGNRPNSTAAANNGHVSVPGGFAVDAATLGATTTAAGSCSAAVWTVTLDAAPAAIHAVAPPGAPNELCPGATLRITFAATAPATEGAYTWNTTLARDATDFELQGSQPKVTVDGTVPPTPTISSAPPNPSNSSNASFAFADGDASATLHCRLDALAYAACTSPTSYAGLAAGTHTFAVKAVDAAGNESPAASRTWTIDLTAPPPPTLTSAPPSVTASTSASFVFTDDDATASYLCRLDGAAFAACTSPKAYAGLSAGDHVFDVKARDPAGNESPVKTHAWTIDLTNPVVTIDPATQPHDPTNGTAASFTFTSNKLGSTFACALDGAGFSACTSPAAYSGLSDRRHRFAVRATDPLGTTGLATVWEWTVDTHAPATPAVDSAPRSPTNATAATLVFHGGELGLHHSCRLDGGGFAACSSPVSYSRLADGPHTFAVRSTDAAGNVGPAVTRGWVVDTRPPHTTITGAPAAVSSSASASFIFAGSEASSFACSLDGGSFSPCSSPRSYGGLRDGGHAFRVRATDLAGNAETAPPSFSWQVLALLPPDLTPPGRVRRLHVNVGYGFLRLSWLPPADPDLDHVQVRRGRSAKGGSQTTVYQGRATKYVDRRFENGSYFVYRVRSYDRAGNVSGSAPLAVSPAALLRSPRNGGVVRASTPLLAWAKVPRAGYYNVQLYRGAQKLLSAWPVKAKLALAQRWAYQGRAFRLGKGLYRWYVWPGFGARSQSKYGHLLGTATFTVR